MLVSGGYLILENNHNHKNESVSMRQFDESQWNHFMIHMDMFFRKTDRLKNSSFFGFQIGYHFFSGSNASIVTLGKPEWDLKMAQ